ncbi:UNVERIFIED_CONTAM: hypothetical protein NY603_33490, partial [Bacteroidetes bacterium 56_B9]
TDTRVLWMLWVMLCGSETRLLLCCAARMRAMATKHSQNVTWHDELAMSDPEWRINKRHMAMLL